MNAHRLATPDLVRLFDSGSMASLSEWQLLERFVAHRDELAFEALVSRHGPMVLGICRRMLGNSQDVDDAFQATFLVLLKRAGSLGPGDTIAAWLHGVAVRVAQQARSAAFRHHRRERTGVSYDIPGPDPVVDDPELRRVLDEEINRLPWKYRAPIVLCYLEGRTHEEAAQQLDWPLGTVKGRLARARSRLETRLTRRGLACGAALAALAAGTRTQAGVAGPLIEATCRAAARLGTGKLTAQVVSASIVRLAQGVLTAMMFQKLKLIALGAIASGFLLTGAGVLARQQGQGPTEPFEKPGNGSPDKKLDVAATGLPRPGSEAAPAGKVPPTPMTENDLYRAVLQAARHAYMATRDDYHKGRSAVQRVHSASRLLMEAEAQAGSAPSGPAQKVKAVEAHLERMRELARDEEHAGDDDPNGTEARAFLAEAELLVAQAKAPKPKPSPAAPPTQSGAKDGPGQDPKSQAILAKLEEPVSMSFPNETPLEDLLKYIKQATQVRSGSGIPIYVDPLGLQEADKTLNSTVQLDLEGIPLRRTLQLALKQLGLIYFVDDGLLVITSGSSEDLKLPPSRVEPPPFGQKMDRFERGDMKVEEMKTFVEELKMRKEILKLEAEIEKAKAEVEKAQLRGGGVQ
jgi:RNA polymerase sigma factor (sigma-70 family)